MTGPAADAAIRRLLHAIRRHLGLDAAFASQFCDGERVLRHVDTDAELWGVRPGDAHPLERSACHHVLRGELPALLHDPTEHPLTAELEGDGGIPLGTRLTVPITLADGSVFGTCGCAGRDVHRGLDTRDLDALRMVAGVVAEYLDDAGARHQRSEHRRERLAAVTERSNLLMVFQPIACLSTLDPVGYEALARFPDLVSGPAEIFAEARRQGVEVEVELKAVRAALEHIGQLPERSYLSVNASPTTLTDEGLLRAVQEAGPDRIVVEITEHAAVQDYDRLLGAVRHLTDLGVRLAIDDVGMGVSGLHHILRLSPHIIKIDAALVRDIHTSPPKQALISALVAFAARTSVALVAEGIESAAELQALRVLGVEYGQGYHISRPRAEALVA